MKNKALKMYSVPQSDNNQSLLYSISRDSILNKTDLSAYKHFLAISEVLIWVCASGNAPAFNKTPSVSVPHPHSSAN